MKKEERITCDRCGKWHQRLFKSRDNMKQSEEWICLSCLAELLHGRLDDIEVKTERRE